MSVLQKLFGARPVENPLTVLAVGFAAADRELLQRASRQAGWRLLAAEIPEAATPASIVLLDRENLASDWRDAMQRLATTQSQARIILASPVADDYLWEEVIHNGGYDVLVKPFREEDVIRTVQFAHEAARLTKSLPS